MTIKKKTSATKRGTKRKQIAKSVATTSQEVAAPPAEIPVRVGDVVKTKSDGSFLSDMQGIIVGSPNNNEVTIRVCDYTGAYFSYIGDRLYNIPLASLELVERRTRILGV